MGMSVSLSFFFLLISGCFFCRDYDNSKANSRFYVSCSLVLSFFLRIAFFLFMLCFFLWFALFLSLFLG